MRPTLTLRAGPDGAGRTTYARRRPRQVAGTDAFTKVDEIARVRSRSEVHDPALLADAPPGLRAAVASLIR